MGYNENWIPDLLRPKQESCLRIPNLGLGEVKLHRNVIWKPGNPPKPDLQGRMLCGPFLVILYSFYDYHIFNPGLAPYCTVNCANSSTARLFLINHPVHTAKKIDRKNCQRGFRKIISLPEKISKHTPGHYTWTSMPKHSVDINSVLLLSVVGPGRQDPLHGTSLYSSTK